MSGLFELDEQVDRSKFESHGQTQRMMEPSFAFLRKLFIKHEKERNSLKSMLQYAMKTVSCKRKSLFAKSVTIFGRGFNYYTSPTVHFGLF